MENTAAKEITDLQKKTDVLDNTEEDFRSKYISCPRFGGKRLIVACAHFDRFVSCRRECPSLKKALVDVLGFEDKVKKVYEELGRKTYGPSTKSCKYLPNKPFGCKFCNFTAKSERGLKIHMRRTHDFLEKKEGRCG
jgi:hypothetical protein